MTIELKIDTNALEALFADPEAKVKLQQAVIEEFTRRHIKEAFKAVESTNDIDKAVNAAKSEALEKFVTKAKTGWSTSYVLKPEFANTIKNLTDECVRQFVTDAVTNETKQLERWIGEQIHKRVQAEISKVSAQVVAEQVQEKMVTVRQMLDNMAKMA